MARRIRTHANPLSFKEKMLQVDFSEVFSSFSGTLDFEIGFGKGRFLTAYAKTYPNRHIVAVDVRKGLIPDLTIRLKESELKNVYLCHGTGERCLEDLIPDASLDRVFIFHPDPWFKKRHHKRRVVRPEFLTALEPKLRPDARLYISTDVTPLWEAMCETLDSSRFQTCQDPEFWENDYQSHWSVFSEQDQRPQHFGTWTLLS